MNGSAVTRVGPVVRVAWAYGEDRDLADRLLLDLLADGPAASGPIHRLCPWCGSDCHGRPVVAGRAHPHLSIARAGALTVVAVCETAPIGVDVERDGAAGRPAAGVLHAREIAEDDLGSTVTWVRKEALLKATGHGLGLDPTTVRLSAPDAPPELLAWPEPAAPTVWLGDLATAPGYTAAVAVMTSAPVTVRVSPAAGAGPSTTATR